MKTLFITVFIINCIVVSTWAHAGLSAPAPRGEACTATSDLAVCGLTAAPCGGNIINIKIIIISLSIALTNAGKRIINLKNLAFHE
jgi:hypothetical protein